MARHGYGLVEEWGGLSTSRPVRSDLVASFEGSVGPEFSPYRRDDGDTVVTVASFHCKLPICVSEHFRFLLVTSYDQNLFQVGM